jgi:hypothetical protein
MEYLNTLEIVGIAASVAALAFSVFTLVLQRRSKAVSTVVLDELGKMFGQEKHPAASISVRALDPTDAVLDVIAVTAPEVDHILSSDFDQLVLRMYQSNVPSEKSVYEAILLASPKKKQGKPFQMARFDLLKRPELAPLFEILRDPDKPRVSSGPTGNRFFGKTTAYTGTAGTAARNSGASRTEEAKH